MIGLSQMFSKSGPRMGSINITGGLVKNAHFQAPTEKDLLNQNLWEDSPAICVFTNPLDDSVKV